MADKEQKQEKTSEEINKDKAAIASINVGINLIPRKSEEEIKVDTKKFRVNYISVFFILLISVVSMILVGVNTYMRTSLNQEKSELRDLEREIVDQNQIVQANNSLIERATLYQEIQESTFSPKSVLNYWDELSGRFGEINQIELTNGLEFTFTGTANNLTEVARLWHLLSIDQRVSNITLSQVSTSSDGARYQFDGKLNPEYFLNSSSVELITPTPSPTPEPSIDVEISDDDQATPPSAPDESIFGDPGL